VFHYGPDRQYYRQEYSGPGGAETTEYIGGILEKVSSGGVTDWRHYIFANGQPVAIVSRKDAGPTPNTVSYRLEDHQGSPATLTDGSGAELVRQSFTPFGQPRDGSDWSSAVSSGDQAIINGISRRGYTGQTMLGNMGLIHMNGRVQDAITGRFLSPDPTIPNPGFTQSFNRYAYVNNNPLSFIDPSGFKDELDTVNVIGTRIITYLCYGFATTDPADCSFLSLLFDNDDCQNNADCWQPWADLQPSDDLSTSQEHCSSLSVCKSQDQQPKPKVLKPWSPPMLDEVHQDPAARGAQIQLPAAPCLATTGAARVAEGIDKAATWAGRGAIGLGVGAAALSETVVGGAILGVAAGIAEGSSYLLAGVSAGIKWFTGNREGAAITAASAAVGFVVPKGLVRTVPGLTGSSKDFGEFVAGVEGDAASQMTEFALCLRQ